MNLKLFFKQKSILKNALQGKKKGESQESIFSRNLAERSVTVLGASHILSHLILIPPPKDGCCYPYFKDKETEAPQRLREIV